MSGPKLFDQSKPLIKLSYSSKTCFKGQLHQTKTQYTAESMQISQFNFRKGWSHVILFRVTMSVFCVLLYKSAFTPKNREKMAEQ